MIESLAHIGIAVKDLKASSKLFQALLGKPSDHSESVPDQKVETAFFHVGQTAIELTAASDAESSIAKFIEKRGEGIHHLSFVVDDLGKELSRLKAEGFQLVDEKPRVGADGHSVAFLHPKSTNGVLIELCQRTKIHKP
jgi:methylmalonyl-CoA/ethylmalonyl-CoA epimerase